MTEYLDLDDLRLVALRAVGDALAVRDDDLLESALGRLHATVFGADAYPDLYSKAAALMHSLAKNHPLADGNKRLCWTACRTFLVLNGVHVTATVEDRFSFVVAVAAGQVADVPAIAAQLRVWSV
ncbi:death-on-curing family protein (plasmid) [Mycobacterium sp. JS623]|uniref:type II toxin-antitoxin system death-on-curing family toxin n=1 Tax=Mycobacterium sp. JS623 TaxID=212767 RepID=UPI0002A578B0|nr:type II toxin-antitoxin system death-on-curing family toxin [Mycobacterium sp. JS623]AGB27029.1 death-on-curing family protein [Mycobacterium sp. JS623]